MIISEYGRFAETSKERRKQLQEYTKLDVNAFYFVVCNMNDESNEKGKTGAAFRRNRFNSASRIEKMMYRFTHNIGTAWIIVRIATSTIGDLNKTDYSALFDTKLRVKATNAFYKVIDRLLHEKKAKVVDSGNNYVTDFWEYYLKEGRNWGYALERYLFGISNRDITDKKDGILGKKGIQVKTSFTLYRSRKEEKTSGGFYEIGTGKGVSTSNGI